MTTELSLWQRVDALRELMMQGGLLLGDVVTLTRNAEESLAAAAAERKNQENNRLALEEECSRLRLQAYAVNETSVGRQTEMTALRVELERSRNVSEDSAQRVSVLQAELLSLRQQAPRAQASSSEQQMISELQHRLQTAEARLEQARLTLETERERRNRAISLIKPVSTESQNLQSSPA